MFLRVSGLIALVGVFSLTGCGDAGLTSPDDVYPEMATVEGAHQDIMVPVRWTYHMTATGTDLLICSNSDGSPPWMAIPVNFSATGRMSHLGRLDADGSGAVFTACTVNLVGGVPISAVGAAGVELVGANGDAVFLEGSLTLDFAENIATGQWTITGGTGRFEGASGWIKTWEQASAGGSGSAGTGDGMITPPGVLTR